MIRLPVLVLLAAAASAQEADPTPPWRYDPVGVGNARSYFQGGATATPYWRTDSPTALTIDGQRWVVRRRQGFSRVSSRGELVGWSRTEDRVLVRYDTTEANVMVRQADGTVRPLYPCRLDLPLGSGPCGDGTASYSKGGDGRLRFDSGVAPGLYLEAGIGNVGGPTEGGSDVQLVGAVIDGDTLIAESEAFPDSRLDPTPASRYAPMSVGDEWQYAFSEGPGHPVLQYRRRQVVETREINGRVYLGSRHGSFVQGEGDWTYSVEIGYARFDTLTARVVGPDGSPGSGCSLDEPSSFLSENGISCTSDSEFPGPIATAVLNSVRVGGDTFETSIRSFLRGGIADYDCFPGEHAAGIGYVGFECGGGAPFVYYRLIYARVRQPDGSVLELGRPYAVAADDAPEPGRPALTVGPNPAVGPATLRLAVPVGGAVQWEAFDALGRRVWQRAETVPAGETARPLNVSDWPSGLYVVRATTASGAVTAAVVRQ